MPSNKSSLIEFRLIRYITLFIALFLTACVTSEYNVATHKQDVFFYSTEREVAMGRNIAKKIDQEYDVSNNPYDIKRVNEIAEKLVKVIDRQELNYYFYVIEKDDKEREQFNAFSIPGGYVYIYKDLLDVLNDDELAFVLAHEIGHIVSRHHMKRLQAAMGYNLVMIASAAAPSSSGFSNGLSFALAQILTGYSQEDELNADELAVKYCQLSGFDPKAGIALQDKLYEKGKKEIRPLSYFKTHPYSSERIRHIKETLHLPLDIDDYIN